MTEPERFRGLPVAQFVVTTSGDDSIAKLRVAVDAE
jgi:hypothetical protein